MKRNYLLILASVLTPLLVSGQSYYDDDIYYNPSKVKKTEKREVKKQKTEKLRILKNRHTRCIQAILAMSMNTTAVAHTKFLPTQFLPTQWWQILMFSIHRAYGAFRQSYNRGFV